MEEIDVDLQDYINVILKWWILIIVVFVGAVAVSAVVSFRQPPIYQASVTMFERSYQVVAAPRLYSTDKAQKSYTSLAKSPLLEERVIQVLESALSPADKAPGALLSRVTVVPDKENPAVFEIKVRHIDPELAVRIANTWASEYIETFSELNAGPATELAFIREQLALAESDLETSEQALRAFEQESGLGIAPNQGYGFAIGSVMQDPYVWYGIRGKEFEAKTRLLADHLVARDNLVLLLDVAQEARDTGSGVDDLPLQLLDAPAIAGRGQLCAETIIQDAEDLDAVVGLLEAEEQSLTSVIDVLASQVEELHTELMQDKYQYLLLNGTRNALLERIAMLSYKAQELELEASGAYVIDRAVGAVVASPGPWLNVIVAGTLGLMMGIMLAFGLEYLGRARATSAK